MVEIQPDWIQYDFTNAQSFAGTIPVYCEIAGEPIEGKNWTWILVGITERELNRPNSALEPLYSESLLTAKKDRPFFAKERLGNLHCVRLSNDHWICVNYNTPAIIGMIGALCLRCGYTEGQILLYGEPRRSATTRASVVDTPYVQTDIFPTLREKRPKENQGSESVEANPPKDISKESFIHYLVDSCGVAEHTARGYARAIRKNEELAREYGLHSTQLYVGDREVAKRTADELLDSAEFREYSTSHHNTHGAALRHFRRFLDGKSASNITMEPVKTSIETEAVQKPSGIQAEWIKYDFTNAQKFTGTVPVCCAIDGEPIEGKTWAKILVAITSRELARHNSAMDRLRTETLKGTKNNRPYLLREKLDHLICERVSDEYWICTNHGISQLVEMIGLLCLRCEYVKEQIVLYGKVKMSAGASMGEVTPVKTKNATQTPNGRGVPIEKLEAYLLSVGLRGATVNDLINAVQPDAAVSPTLSALGSSMNILAMPGNRYVHVESIVDLDEAEEVLGRILRLHFEQFGGYSNNQLLFGAASQELSMFLNDNDCGNVDAVYDIARFLFEKRARAGSSYKFFMSHIFEKEPDYPMSLRGLLIHLARRNSGFLYVSEAKDYLQKTKLSYASIGQLLELGSSNTFLIHDSDLYLLSESLGIDDEWCRQVHDRLKDLFRRENVAYVIPRDINTAWLTMLPPLPQGLNWTLLLLQEVLDKYPAIGFKSISPNLHQAYDTLAAAFVPNDSPLQTFPDVVAHYMGMKHPDLPKHMSAESLRLELRGAGMLENNEMIYALPRALDDYRFAWSDENKTVYVRGNK